MRTIIFSYIVVISLFSCGRINKLSKDDYSWIPYRGNETLVFKSNNNESDTIFLLKKDTLIAYPEAQALNGVKYEVVSIFCRHLDSYRRNGNPRYLENSFLELRKSKDNHTELNLNLMAKNAQFYNLKGVKLDSLQLQKPISIVTQSGQYDDVYVIYAGALDFTARDNYISKLYWSKLKGLVKFEKKNEAYWELAKTY